MKSDHWLSGVARILRAETDDLRELVRIGGVDPRTAYVGTRLEGVDISGQDLRGMIFTDLDLSRLQYDAGTLIDRNVLPDATEPLDALPPYGAVEHALLNFLLHSGPVEPKAVYGPLADRFGLSESQRTTTRKDNSTPRWNNRVQWARQALKRSGFLTGTRGVWALTTDGLKAAKMAVANGSLPQAWELD